MTEGWGGDERRGIPIHLLSFMNEQVEIHTNKVEKLLNDHIRDEEGQFDEFIKTLHDNNKDSQERHFQLVQQLTAIAGTQQLMTKAFVVDEDGQPDYRGHANSHKSWIRKADDEDKVMAYVRKQMAKDERRNEDIRFALRAVVIVVVGALVMWGGKELLYAAHHAAEAKSELVR